MATRAEAAAELLARRRAREGMLSFTKYVNPDYIVSDFSLRVCSALDQFLLDVDNGLRPILILSAPPQHGKSELVSRMLPAVALGKDPQKRIAGLSYGKDLATDMNRDIQRVMMGDDYGNIFPGSRLNSRRVVTMDGEAKRNSDMFEFQKARGSYIGQGVGGPLTGKRVDIGIIDDPIKNAKEALSATVKDAVWNWYTSTFLTRLSKNSGQIIMATRWATDDLSGRILASNPRARSLVFPAIDDNGNALIPELHPIEKLMEIKATMSPHFWSAMYQQRPTPVGGTMFKADWWKYYEILPKMRHLAIYGDTAQKTKTQNDYSVFELWGETVDGQAALIDMVRGKWEAPELLVTALSFWEKHKGKYNVPVRAMKIEDKSSGTGLVQTISRKGIPVIPIPRDTDKITRGFNVAPFIQSGQVMLPSSAPWMSDFLIECGEFPNGSYDDQVDPMMDAITDILQKNNANLKAWL